MVDRQGRPGGQQANRQTTLRPGQLAGGAHSLPDHRQPEDAIGQQPRQADLGQQGQIVVVGVAQRRLTGWQTT